MFESQDEKSKRSSHPKEKEEEEEEERKRRSKGTFRPLPSFKAKFANFPASDFLPLSLSSLESLRGKS